MWIKGRYLDAPFVVVASGLAFAGGSAAIAGDTVRAFGLVLAVAGLLWKAIQQ